MRWWKKDMVLIPLIRYKVDILVVTCASKPSWDPCWRTRSWFIRRLYNQWWNALLDYLWDTGLIFLLGRSRSLRLLSLLGRVDFPSSGDHKHTNSPWRRSATDPLRRTQTNKQTNRPSVTVSSGVSSAASGVRLLQGDPLGHLPGAVQGQPHPHRGHRHGDGVDDAALRLHLHLAGDLPLQRDAGKHSVWYEVRVEMGSDYQIMK